MVCGEQAREQLPDPERQLGQETLQEEEPALIVIELGAQRRKDCRIDQEPLGIITVVHVFLIFQQVLAQNSIKA